ncbi:MAG: Putative HMP/thiamine import ATP-binding protein YkoD [Desulfovibrio sp.]
MLRFENVSYTYPFQQRPAVSNISLEVRPGELVLCTGASGCGKSTLIRLANGLCPLHFEGTLEGRVLVNGTPTTEQGLPRLARQAGTLFQDPEQQFFALNVEDELSFALEWQGMPVPQMHEAVNGAVRHFGLESLLGASIHELSEGQKQKVGLAVLWTQNPQALILDEPTANLDPESTAELALRLGELKRKGMAILVVDHRLYWLADVADRVVIMQDGLIREQGDFSLLHDDALRARYGLRQACVPDARPLLPSASEADEKIVDVHGLTYAHKGGQPLYENARMSLPAGITALIGPNGTGKTTLARVLAGLNQPQAGEIRLCGQALNSARRLARTGIVLQNADHQLHMRTALAEVRTCLELAGSRDTGEATALLTAFGLQDLALRHPQSLSGGEKQRLVIACALAKKPDLLILDEPTSGLDGLNMTRLAQALEEQTREGRCILLITHDLELLALMGRHALRLPLTRADEDGLPAGPAETETLNQPARQEQAHTRNTATPAA